MRKGTTGGVKITRKKSEPWISVPPLGKQEEPTGLKALKAEISRRWGVIDLLDVLKDVAHVTDYTDAFTSVASRIVIDPAVLQRRLLLCLYGLGTNVGIKRVADGVAAAALPPGQIDNEAAHPPVVHQPRQPARGDPPHRQRHPEGARHGAVGRGHLVRVRFAKVRVVVG
ncbi:Tn3 family transposase [Nonomuraea sp. NPDC049269]|uniref:Tn3 family transposase n=1 Tax=Nonomuraea sp. NPDC049269 TaxID=3364349 RepID=UPI00371B1B95